MSAPAIRLRWELSAEHRFAAESLAAAAGARVTADAGPEVELDPADLDLAFRHLARVEEGPGAELDAHGRFPAASSCLRSGEAPVDALVPRVAAVLRARGVELAPVWPGGARFFVALTHDIDTPWRWTSTGLRGAASRLKRSLQAGRLVDASVEARGLARAPLHRLRGTDPNWCFERVAELESARGFSSTSYVLAAHRDPHDGSRPDTYARLRPRLVQELASLGGEVGLHGSYRSSEDESLLRAERHDLEQLLGAPVRGLRFHYLRMRWHDVVGRLDRIGIEYDATLGFSDRPGARAGFSFPFTPWDAAAGRPAAFLELPLVLMDATLAEKRYLGLSASSSRKQIDRVLERLAESGGGASILWHNDRFDPVYGRGWDGAYEYLLDGIVSRGGTAGTAAAL
ncbi:MAG TPA: polysaccharide deacetylase family protein, partial [Gaiellales bacterium]